MPLLPTPVVTQANGTFSFTTHNACPSQSSLVYLAATGGNPGLGGSVNNPAIAGLSVIGTCQDLANSTYLNLNEVTTVAAVSALAPFLTSPSAIGSASSDAPNLAAAFTLATQFANLATGTSPGTNLPAGYAAPTAALYTLADAVAPCINSNGTDGNCATLFSYTTAPNQPAPTDVVGALRTIALFPTQNVAQITNLAAPASPYQPILTQTPNTLALALVSTSTTLSFSAVAFPSTTATYTSAQQDLVITNSGANPAVFASVPFTLGGTSPSEFTEASNCTTLAPGASCDVLLTATPSTTGTRTATLNIAANTAQSYTVPLSVVGVTASAGPVSVSGAPSFTTSYTSYDIVVTNSGTKPLTFKAPSGNSPYSTSQYYFSIGPNTCVGILAAGRSCTITVSTDGSEPYSNLVINDDAAGGPQVVGVNQVISTNPSYTNTSSGYLFPVTPVGSSSTATIGFRSNSRFNDVSYSGTITGANASEFSPSSVSCSGPGNYSTSTPGYCTVTITFTPTANGVRSARLSSGGNDCYLLLNATTGAPGLGPLFSFGAASYNLSSFFNGSGVASGSVTVVLKNNGNTTLNFPAFQLYSSQPGTLSQSGSTCATVAPGASCSVVVSSSTTTVSSFTATLVAKDSGSGLVQSVPINVATYYQSPTATPGSLAFGSISKNTSSAVQSFTVADPNGQPLNHPLTLNFSSASAGSASAFTFPNGTSCPASSTSVCTFSVQFSPTSPGSYTSNYLITDSLSGQATPITFTGSSTTPAQVSFSNSSLAFPSTQVNYCANSSATTVISNSGYTPLTISSISIPDVAGNNFRQTNNCSAPLNYNGSCTVTLYFCPVTAGAQSAHLVVNSNSATSPDSASLSGTGK